MENAIDILKQMVANGDISKELAAKYCSEINESEDDKIMKDILSFAKGMISGDKPHSYDERFERWIEWLEKKKEDNKWTEKDDDHLAKAMYTCLKFYGGDSSTASWLKNLRNRINSQYKPTKEQLDALNFIIEDYIERTSEWTRDSCVKKNLEALHNDLSKL